VIPPFFVLASASCKVLGSFCCYDVIRSNKTCASRIPFLLYLLYLHYVLSLILSVLLLTLKSLVALVFFTGVLSSRLNNFLFVCTGRSWPQRAVCSFSETLFTAVCLTAALFAFVGWVDICSISWFGLRIVRPSVV
jgi:hypothetical protein